MQDLPIGFDAGGADAWAFQDVLAHGISVGAPPDEFNTRGQNWGLPPFVPARLRARRLRALRPDDPRVPPPRRRPAHRSRDGAVPAVLDPGGQRRRATAPTCTSHADDLLSIVALESQRARAVIVGEDLGTVEEYTRARSSRPATSCRTACSGSRRPARRSIPEQALAAITTHDLPTVAGLWTGSDLEVQQELGLSPNEAGTREIRRACSG